MLRQALIGYPQPQYGLRAVLRSRRTTASQLAEVVGVSHVSVSRWLRALRKPSEAKAIAVAKFFGEPVESVRTYRLRGGQR